MASMSTALYWFFLPHIPVPTGMTQTDSLNATHILSCVTLRHAEFGDSTAFFFFSIFKLYNIVLVLPNFWSHWEAYRISVPRPGIQHAAPALEAWNLNDWTTREVHELTSKTIVRTFFTYSVT